MPRHNSNPEWWNNLVTEYLKNGNNATRAYLKIFPETKVASASTLVQRLFKKVEFQVFLSKAIGKLETKAGMSQQEWFSELISMGTAKVHVNAAAKAKALDIIGKALSYIVDKPEAGGNNITIIFESAYDESNSKGKKPVQAEGLPDSGTQGS